MPEGGVDNGVRCGCSAAQAFQVLQIASMRLGAGGVKRLCTRVRPRQSKYVMACADEFFPTAEPMNPVAPVTNTRIYASLISFKLD